MKSKLKEDLKTSKEDQLPVEELKIKRKLKEDKKLIDFTMLPGLRLKIMMKLKEDKKWIAYNMLQVEQEESKLESLKKLAPKQQISSMAPSMFPNSMTVLTLLVK